MTAEILLNIQKTRTIEGSVLGIVRKIFGEIDSLLQLKR